jgi:hypothetical protein
VADTQAKRTLRRNRIAEALDSAVEGETIMLLELAKIWGVGKPAFVNERDRIPDFPPAVVDGKTYLYPRIPALERLDQWERRADAANAKRHDRLAALVGMELDESAFSITDLQKANQLRLDIEERMKAQGLLVSKAEMQKTAGKIAEILQRNLSALGTAVDPNGQFPPEVAKAADEAGERILLLIHAQMKDMLLKDAALLPTRPGRDGGGDARARGARAPRKRD